MDMKGIKASKLRGCFAAARHTEKTNSCRNGLERSFCLIVDESGRCAFDKESTELFFDHHYNKEGNCN